MQNEDRTTPAVIRPAAASLTDDGIGDDRLIGNDDTDNGVVFDVSESSSFASLAAAAETPCPSSSSSVSSITVSVSASPSHRQADGTSTRRTQETAARAAASATTPSDEEFFVCRASAPNNSNNTTDTAVTDPTIGTASRHTHRISPAPTGRDRIRRQATPIFASAIPSSGTPTQLSTERSKQMQRRSLTAPSVVTTAIVILACATVFVVVTIRSIDRCLQSSGVPVSTHVKSLPTANLTAAQLPSQNHPSELLSTSHAPRPPVPPTAPIHVPSPAFRFCQVPVISQLSDSYRHRRVSKGSVGRSSQHTFRLQYQCKGQAYNDFSDRLHRFVEQKYEAHYRHERDARDERQAFTWGHRPHPLPSNTTVLVFGNSHLRQISKTVVCQYASQIRTAAIIDDDTFRVIFDNDAEWISVTNTPIVYSRQWYTLLLRQLNLTSMQQLDAVVLGKFNTYEETRNTNFDTIIRSKVANDPNSSIDFEHIEPPNLLDVVSEYRDGPVVSVSMFSLQDVYRAQSIRQTIRTQNQKAEASKTQLGDAGKLEFVDARQYVNLLGECGSDDKITVGTCHEPGDVVPNSNRNPADMHRCTGPRGGHPDLVGWDIIEKLHSVLPKRREI